METKEKIQEQAEVKGKNNTQSSKVWKA